VLLIFPSFGEGETDDDAFGLFASEKDTLDSRGATSDFFMVVPLGVAALTGGFRVGGGRLAGGLLVDVAGFVPPVGPLGRGLDGADFPDLEGDFTTDFTVDTGFVPGRDDRGRTLDFFPVDDPLLEREGSVRSNT
jgi:hypothetical protein